MLILKEQYLFLFCPHHYYRKSLHKTLVISDCGKFYIFITSIEVKDCLGCYVEDCYPDDSWQKDYKYM